MWRWPELYVAIIAATILVRVVFDAAFKDKVATYYQGQIESMKAQDQRSIDDRAWLHEELTNTKAALRRLEKTVKTGEYP